MSKRLRDNALALATIVTAVVMTGCDPQDLPPNCRIEAITNPPPPPAELTINPASLREALFNGNTSVLLGLNRVHQAKEQVNIARGNLLPSIQLSGLLYSGGNPVFILSTVEFLVPFLVPERWFDYYKMKDILQAELQALRLLRLNQYASAYSLILAMSSDLDLQRTFDDEVADLERIRSIVELLHGAGAAPLSDLDAATAALEMTRISSNKISELVASEFSSLRRALGLPLETRLILGEQAIPQSEWEDGKLPDVLPRTLELSPEVQQMALLRKAAEKERWSKVFGFLTGASVRSESVGSDHSAALSDAGGGLGFGLGFSYYPAIKLSQEQEQALALRSQELENELTDVVDIALIAIAKAKDRLTMAESAASHSEQAYRARLLQYQSGAVTLDELIRSRMSLRKARIEEIQAKARLSLSRVTLHRTLLSDQFEKIEGCDISAAL